MDAAVLQNLLLEYPVVAAIKDAAGLENCLRSDTPVVFVLFGDILTISSITARLKEAKKISLIHADLVEGLAAREIAVNFIAKNTEADGILSIKPTLVKHAKSLGLLTIQRFFLLDSIALINIQKQLPLECADMIEILPGPMPKITKKVVSMSSKPVIVGGLISDKEDIISSLKAGASAVSTSNPTLWSV